MSLMPDELDYSDPESTKAIPKFTNEKQEEWYIYRRVYIADYLKHVADLIVSV